MLALHPSLLARVTGGAGEESAPNVTTIKKADGTDVYTARTERGYCQDLLERNCRAANPGLLWGTNEKAAGQCYVKQVDTTCPPSLSTGTK